MQLPLYGLYAITDSDLIPAAQFIETIEQAIMGGAQVIQYRDKSHDKVRQLEQAQAIRDLCQKYQIPFLINDNVALAQQVEADGVHLGNNDVEIATARILLGDDAIIGASCYNQMDLARQALEEGATYVAFGRFFDSATKPEAVHASVDLLREAKEIFDCPLVAIGGITPDNGAELIAAGADCLAVIQGVFGQTDVITAAQRYAQLFPEQT